MTEKSKKRTNSKVGRLIDEYGLDGFGAELEARWTGDGVQRASLRDLARTFNERLLERALVDAGASVPRTDVETTYENLTGEDVSAGVRTDTRTRLERAGVDVAKLRDDFVTYQAIRTYLREWRGAEYDHLSDAEKVEKDRESIQRLLSRTLSVTETRIENLRATDRIDAGAFEVVIDARILCQECGMQRTVQEFLDEGGCDCRRNP